MLKFEFELNEKAIGKERPRFNSVTRTTYTPSKTRNFEEKVRNAFMSKYNVQLECKTKPFRAEITVYFKPSNSLSKKAKKELIEQKFYTRKPDSDNLAKAILDSLNGLAYEDDGQVVQLFVTKYWGEENKVNVVLEELR